MIESPQYTYRLDAADRISYVSPEWLRFAIENEAPELDEAAVLGRELWDFVDGEATRRLYALLFADLRARRIERRIPFRCDSPTRIRQMSLTLRSLADGGIELEGRLLASEAREAEPLFARGARRAEGTLRICSVCRRLDAGDDWVEVAEAIVRRRLFSSALPPRLGETVCPDCARWLAGSGDAPERR